MSIVRRLIFHLQVLQTVVHRMVASAATPPTARPVSNAPALVPASTPIGAHKRRAALAISLSSSPFSTSTLFLRSVLLPSWLCLSCAHLVFHGSLSIITVAGVRTAAPLSAQPPSQRLQPLCPPTLPHMPCVRLSFSPHQTTVWWASALPTAPVKGAVADTLHLQCSPTADASGAWSLLRQAVQLVFCNLQLALHQPALCDPRSPVSVGKRLGGGSPMNDAAVTPLPSFSLLVWGSSTAVACGVETMLVTMGSWAS